MSFSLGQQVKVKPPFDQAFPAIYAIVQVHDDQETYTVSALDDPACSADFNAMYLESV